MESKHNPLRSLLRTKSQPKKKVPTLKEDWKRIKNSDKPKPVMAKPKTDKPY